MPRGRVFFFGRKPFGVPGLIAEQKRVAFVQGRVCVLPLFVQKRKGNGGGGGGGVIELISAVVTLIY